MERVNTIVETLIKRAKGEIKKIILPESTDIRVLQATAIIVKDKIADVILIGNKSEISRLCIENNIDIELNKVIIINPLDYSKREQYVEKLYELRKHKGLTMSDANKLLENNVYFGVMMVKTGDADGLVSGAIHSSADTLRPALQIIKQAEGIKSVSSFFLMQLPDDSFGYNGIFVFSDCGLIEFPTEEQLIDITVSSANTFKYLVNAEPKVALLSYSTKGSVNSNEVNKLQNVLKKLQNLNIDFDVDGELQLDAAVVKEVAKLKSPTSKVAGEANVLIFPDIQAGNIGYKLTQRFGHAIALGPITQGLAKPVNDLSRGCTAQDIIGAVAITCVQAQML